MQLNRVTDLPLMLIDYEESALSAEELMQLGVRIHFNGHRAYEDSVKATYQSLLQLHNGREYRGSTDSDQNAKQLIGRFARQQKFTAMSNDYLDPVAR